MIETLKLTEEQKMSIEYDEGPLIISAGPGTGKTLILTKRLIYLLNKSKKEKYKILALTFTNKAAKEMRDRIEKEILSEVNRVFIGTFHSFCYEILLSYGHHIGINSDFIIYDDIEDILSLIIEYIQKIIMENSQDNNKNIEDILKIVEKYRTVDRLKTRIRIYYPIFIRLKNNFIHPDDQLLNNISSEVKVLYQLYIESLRNYNVLDFSDLIYYTIKLFEDKPFIKKHLRTIYKHILIDEGQDINYIQYKLIKTLCDEDFKNLFIVADEDQLIFEWNDAKFEYLKRLNNEYNMKIIFLYQSFRCPKKILELANKLISNNKSRFFNKKEIISIKNNTNDVIKLNKFNTQKEEAFFIIQKIKELHKKRIKYNNICIIGRTRYLFETLIQLLEKNQIPYYIPMIQEKFVSNEMHFIINLMKLILNENDIVAYNKICDYLFLNSDKFSFKNLDKSYLNIIIEIISEKNLEIKELIYDLKKKMNDFKKYINEIFEIYRDEGNLEFLNDIEFFNEIIQDFENEYPSNENNLQNFLNYLALSSRKEGKGIAILTSHSSKGREFDYVFIISVNQEIFPDYRALQDNGRKLEEERRNFYVAITRTKKKLYLSYVESKETRSGYIKKLEPSQFLREMGLIQ